MMPAGPVVKVCGLTRLDDILAACKAGVWALGFIFAPSLRKVTAAQAALLLDDAASRLPYLAAGEIGPAGRALGAALFSPGAHGPLTVGVFGEAGPEEVASVVRSVGLDAVQLHGTSSPDPDGVREALRGWTPPLKLAARALGSDAEHVAHRADEEPLIIRAVGVSPEEGDAEAVRRRLVEVYDQGALPLIDAKIAGRMGGTGRSVSWPLVAEAASGLQFLLAGGIGPANVREALSASGAWGVDVCSGVERAPGDKDVEALMDLVAKVREEAHARRHEGVQPGDFMGRAEEGSRQ